MGSNASSPIQDNRYKDNNNNGKNNEIVKTNEDDMMKSNGSNSTESTSLNNNIHSNNGSWPMKPLDLYTKVMSNTTKLLGWDHDKMQTLMDDIERKRQAQGEEDENDVMTVMDQLGSGLLRMATDTLANLLLPDDVSKLQQQQQKNQNIHNNSLPLVSSSTSKLEEDANSSRSLTLMNNIDIMPLYQYLLSSIKDQRDIYMMGLPFFNYRKKLCQEYEEQYLLYSKLGISNQEMEKIFQMPSLQTTLSKLYLQQNPNQLSTLTFSQTANIPMKHQSYNVNDSLGQTQFNDLLKWFIPSSTVHDPMRSILIWTFSPPPLPNNNHFHKMRRFTNVRNKEQSSELSKKKKNLGDRVKAISEEQPQKEGPLHQPIKRAITDIIPLSQENVDYAMKSTVLWFLKDEQMRDIVKGSTKGYVSSHLQKNSDHLDNNNIHDKK